LPEAWRGVGSCDMRSLVALFSFLVTACALAHPVHTSTAEAEYNPQTKRLEVSLTVFISDLETALIRQSEREMRMEKTLAAEFDAQVLAYLKKTFVVTDAAGRAAKMRWVGREMEKESAKSGDPAVMLFFEVEMPEVLKGAMVRDAVFLEVFKEQCNLVHLRNGAQSVELRFQQGVLERRLDAEQ